MTLIALNNLTKKYPGVIANDDITFEVVREKSMHC